MSIPLVSVVLPVYNAEKYIAETIQSVISQTVTNWELIIIDDASTDNTAEVIKTFEDSRIIYVRNEANKGVSLSSNYGASMARGQFIMKQDADDISMPDRMQTQLSIFDKKDIDIVTGGAIFFNDSGDISVNANQLDHQEIKVRLLLTCPIMNPTLMLRKSVIERIDYWYDEKYNGPEDYDFYCRAISSFQFYNTDQLLIRYRVHHSPDRLSSSLNKDHYYQSTLSIRQKYWVSCGLEAIASKWTPVYETFFYSRNRLDITTAKIVCEFYQVFYKAAMEIYRTQLQGASLKKFELFIKRHFSNHYYPYSCTGMGAFFLLLRYRSVSAYSFAEYAKFFAKAMFRK